VNFPSALALTAVLACACCEGARAQEVKPAPELIAPGPDIDIAQQPVDYYVLSPAQVRELNTIFTRLTEAIQRQKQELEDLREKTKPIGSCG